MSFFDGFMAPVRTAELQVYTAAVVGGDSARYYYMKPSLAKKDLKEMFIQVKKLLKALKGEK